MNEDSDLLINKRNEEIMYIREYMHTNVITVSPDTLIHDAQKMMEEKNIRRMPVVDGGKLVGLVTQDRLREVAPSPVTQLSIWELNYLLAKMKVKDVMVKDVVTITPDTTVDDAASLGQEHRIGTLPVLDNGRLVGIVTTTDLFNILTGILGFSKSGVRLHILDCGEGWRLRKIIGIVLSYNPNIQTLFRIVPPGTEREQLIIRLDSTDALEPILELINDLRSRGYIVEAR